MAFPDSFRSLRASVLSTRLSLEDFFERWRETLFSCLPVRLRRLLARDEQYLVAVPGPGTAQVYQYQNRQRRLVGELGQKIDAALRAVLVAAKREGQKTVVELSRAQILTRQVAFPNQVRDNLAQVLGYEIDRVSPFQSEEVYFDYRLQEDRRSGEKVRVDLALCRRDLVADCLKRLRENGLPVTQVTWEGAWKKANLLPLRERPQRGSGLFSPKNFLILAVILLAAAALATPIWQLQRTAEARSAQLADLKARAEQVHEARSALERARQGSVAVIQRKWEQPRMIDLILELTERLPDDTWVQNLDYKNGELQIRGESAQATALINLLDQAPGITEVRFRSPVVQVASSGLERFHISMKYQRPEDS